MSNGIVSVRCDLRRAAQILEHVLGFRRSSAFAQEVIRSAQGTYLSATQLAAKARHDYGCIHNNARRTES